MIIIQGIQSHDADRWWPHVEHWAQEALERGGALLHLEDLKEGVANRDMQMWIVFDDKPTAVVITEIVRFKRGDILSAFIIGGENMHRWIKPLDDVLTRYARHAGCKYLIGEGRNGWERVLKPLGWETSSKYMKEL